MILSSRISLCWRLSDDLHQLCTSLEPGQEKVLLQFPKMQPGSMGIDLSPPARQLWGSLWPDFVVMLGTKSCFFHGSGSSQLSQSSLHPSITEPWNRHTPGSTRTINWAKLVLLGGKQLKMHFSGSLTVAS